MFPLLSFWRLPCFSGSEVVPMPLNNAVEKREINRVTAVCEKVGSVMLAGRGLVRWPGGEERVSYRVSVGFDGTISAVHVGPPVPGILQRPSRHGRICLYMPEGQRIALDVAPNGRLSPYSRLERSLDGQDWWVETIPWLPFETPDRLILAMKAGSVQIFESCASPEQAEESYRSWPNVESAEVRPFFGRPQILK